MPNDVEFLRNELAITCVDSLSLMTEHLEDALGDGDRSRFQAHLGGCEACGVYLDQLRLTVEVTGSISGVRTYRVSRDTMDSLVGLYREERA